jgi:hypothetical protein
MKTYSIDTLNNEALFVENGSLFEMEIDFTDEEGNDIIDFTGFELKAQVKKHFGGPVFLEFLESDESIKVEGSMVTMSKVVDLQPSVYVWEMMTIKDGIKERIFKGTIQVNP